ncbi:MAG TPA: hypothetical protein EYQ31_11010 [Candidatus Handelsmanbacteria bacterium]|nr:hypothetical protein [Candidatus Handelsmanbacteria bacterium]
MAAPQYHTQPLRATHVCRLRRSTHLLAKHLSVRKSSSEKPVQWGIGQHVGYPEPQDAAGNLLHDVRDTGKDLASDNVRAYQTNLPINYHNDGADAFMLLCYRAAHAGGESRLVSAVAVFNEILRRRPDLAAVLQEPFDFDARGQERPGARPFQRVPNLHGPCGSTQRPL